MIQKKYIAVLAVSLILLLIGILYSPYLEDYLIPQKMSDRSFTVVEETEMDTTLVNQFLWFDYDGDDIVLHYLPEIGTISTVRYLDPEGNYYDMPIDEFECTDDMGGTIMVTTDEPVMLDLDHDGTAEQVQFTAKTDTNMCKSFYGNPRIFQQEDIALEVAVDRTFADVFVYGEYYSGDITMQSSRSLNEVQTIEEYIPFIDYREIETGLMVFTVYTEDETLVNTYYQEHSLLNTQHLRCMKALGVLLLITIVLIIIMHLVRNSARKRKFSRLQ